MALNDAWEKLVLAKTWLETYIPGSQEWDSAWYHMQWVVEDEEKDSEMRNYAMRAMAATEK